MILESYPTLTIDSLCFTLGIGGEPQADWCEMVGGCLNGGSCYNQCDTFWCDCGEDAAMSVDHFGKRCELSDAKKSYYYKYYKSSY